MRWYDPAIARWISRDPIGYAGGANLYSYDGLDPEGTDPPSGLQLVHEASANIYKLSSQLTTNVNTSEIKYNSSVIKAASATAGVGVAKSSRVVAAVASQFSTASAAIIASAAEGGLAAASLISAPIVGTGGALYYMTVRYTHTLEAQENAEEALSASVSKLSSLNCAALRNQFKNVVKPLYWKEQAKLPGYWTSEDLARMRVGKGPKGLDGETMEVHHIKPLSKGGTNDLSNLTHFSRTDHRLGPNFKKNHPK